MNEELLRLAIEALESDNPDVQTRAAITLRAALAQHEARQDDWKQFEFHVVVKSQGKSQGESYDDWKPAPDLA